MAECDLALPQLLHSLLEAEPSASAIDALYHALKIRRALERNDNVELAWDIEEAEAHGLIPHAARMRIVLAQRTGDRNQLERAWVVLARLGDRRFLHKLAEVEAWRRG